MSDRILFERIYHDNLTHEDMNIYSWKTWEIALEVEAKFIAYGWYTDTKKFTNLRFTIFQCEMLNGSCTDESYDSTICDLQFIKQMRATNAFFDF